LSKDAYTGSAGQPLSQHLYAYALNNPVLIVDPSGHHPPTTTTPREPQENVAACPTFASQYLPNPWSPGHGLGWRIGAATIQGFGLGYAGIVGHALDWLGIPLCDSLLNSGPQPSIAPPVPVMPPQPPTIPTSPSDN
jgi:hypothetical protein